MGFYFVVQDMVAAACAAAAALVSLEAAADGVEGIAGESLDRMSTSLPVVPHDQS